MGDVFSKVRAQSSSASIPPDYVTGSGIDAHAIEVRSKLHPFAQKNLDENVLHLFENTLVLGPHWFGPVPAEVAELLRKDAEAPLCFESTSALASHSWVSKNLSRSFPSSEVRNSPVKWADWIDRLLPRYGGHWRRAGIYDAILLSKQSINRDENLLAAALCFWNSASNTFDFRVGPMAPTLLDMAQIFGFRPHGRPVDAVGDYHRRKNQEKVTTPFTISPATINQNCSFSNYLKRFGTEKDKDQQHMLFLLYWLNRFVFPNRSSAVLLEYRHLAEALHNHTDVGLGPTVLAHLFKNLHTATLENPLNLSAPGAFWMIQIWLQVYFPELRFPDVVLPENQVLALPLISAEALHQEVGCSVASGDQKDLSLVPDWISAFREGARRRGCQNRLQEEISEHHSAQRSAPWWGQTSKLSSGGRIYHPNFCARQLGCPQLIPLKSYRSCNRASSWRDADDLEVHKDARCAVNKINNSADALYPSWEPNSCSSADFDTWWHARFQNLPASVTALKVLFDGWENWLVFADGEARAHMIQTIKDINAQIIENVGGQSVQAGEVIVSSVIAAGDLELPSADEEDDVEAEQTPAEAVPSAGSPSPPPTKLKKLKKKGEVEYFAAEEAAAIPVSPSGTDDELREAFEEVEQEKELQELEEVSQKKVAGAEDDDEIPAEVIAESIALAQKQQKGPSAELTSSELALFEDAEAEHSTAVPEAEDQMEPSASDPVDQAELTVVVPEAEVGQLQLLLWLWWKCLKPLVPWPRCPAPSKPPIVAMPIHSLPGSSTASFADPELEEFEAMDLDAQLDRLEKLSSPPSKAKSRAVQEAMERLKIWQSTELEFDEDKGVWIS
ncbi:autoinhibited Ca2+-ATPase 11 [Prunus dulcis]|uniref:Autoinhibited Ca2+-ATPase 11 n=1 Tax=Prunus dulcis TaxID=3755 RepID=A0A5H2XMY1_PRUDU|nr:autoinhibited Ca2+-ATPase 11 [Prunus dulcis]